MVPNSRGRGFTLIELLVVIAIIAILAAILFPVFARAREKARQTTCSSNQRQIVASLMMYVQDHDETFPNSTNIWQNVQVDPGVLVCPTLGKTTPNGYIFSAYLAGMTLGKINDPTTELVTADGPTLTSSGIPNVGQYLTDLDASRHTNQYIGSMVDGHVQTATGPISNNAPLWAANGGVAGSQNMLWYDPANYNPATGNWPNTAVWGSPIIPFNPGPAYVGPGFSATALCSPPPTGTGLNGHLSVFFPSGKQQWLLGDFNTQMAGNTLVSGNFATANSYFKYSSWIVAKTDSYFTMLTMDNSGGSAARIEGSTWFAAPLHMPGYWVGSNSYTTQVTGSTAGSINVTPGDYGFPATRGTTPMMYSFLNTSSGTLAWFNSVQFLSATGYGAGGTPTWYVDGSTIMNNRRYLDLGMEANLAGTSGPQIGGPDEGGDLYLGDMFIWPTVPTGITTQTRQFIESYLHRKYGF